MKAKKLEKEMNARIKRVIQDLSNCLSLYEEYMKEASDKRKIMFEKKLVIKYGRAIKKLDKRADKIL